MTHDILLNISNLYDDADARSMTPSRNTRSFTLRSVPSSPGRSFLASAHHLIKPHCNVVIINKCDKIPAYLDLAKHVSLLMLFISQK